MAKFDAHADLSGMTDDELRAYFAAQDAAEDAGEIELQSSTDELPDAPTLPTAADEVVATFVPTKPPQT